MNSVLEWHFPDSGVMSTVVNGLLFNLSWFAIVSTQSIVVAPLLATLHLVVHFSLMGRGLTEAAFILLVTLFGVVLDQTLFFLGVFTVNGESSLAPLWISCLWPVLATTFMHAFSGLANRTWLAVICGGIGGAGSYLAGTGLTDVQFGSALWGPWILAGIWMVLFPALLAVALWFLNHTETADASR
jgi:hypothetical protein